MSHGHIHGFDIDSLQMDQLMTHDPYNGVILYFVVVAAKMMF
jgi:hypothetical protein